MSPSWSSSTASSSASTASGGTAGAAHAALEQQEEEDKLERARGVKASLDKLEGTAAAVVREQEQELQREQEQQPPVPSKDTLDLAVSPSKRLLGNKKSTGSLKKLSSADRKSLRPVSFATRQADPFASRRTPRVSTRQAATRCRSRYER